jgi:hypothetical protein
MLDRSRAIKELPDHLVPLELQVPQVRRVLQVMQVPLAPQVMQVQLDQKVK